MEFLLCVLQYLLIMIVLIALGIGAATLGILLRKKNDAKKAAEKAQETNNSQS